MDKEYVVYAHNETEWNITVAPWMDLEEITLIEIFHTKKDNYCVILFMCVT